MSTMGRLMATAMLGTIAACSTAPPPPPQPVDTRTEQRAAPEPADPDRRARLRLELAAGYFARGQSATALEEAKAALAAKPDLPEAYDLLGLIYASLDDAAQAESSFRRALQLAPRSASAMHNYGWFLCQQRRFGEAETLFRQALEQPQYREPARTLFALGVCQARAGRWTEAEASLSRAYELDPTNPATAYNLSEVLYRRGDLERARFYIRRVNATAQTANAQSLWLAIRIENKAGNAASVRTLGTQLRDRFPTSTEALQYERGRFDD
jgi:type IV pilus assembly protein PilF